MFDSTRPVRPARGGHAVPPAVRRRWWHRGEWVMFDSTRPTRPARGGHSVPPAIRRTWLHHRTGAAVLPRLAVVMATVAALSIATVGSAAASTITQPVPGTFLL